ncbi:MAG: hypothetical protein WAW37_06775 [Syntrophobacteraceae bacterium]
MSAVQAHAPQSILADQFFYFFLRLRKNRIKNVVKTLDAAYPAETAEQKARRLITSQTALSFIGGAITHLPMLVPGLSQAFRIFGLVGGASALTRMHLYLILEIALLYGKDIDDEARVPEMLAVVAATGLASGAPLLAAGLLDFVPLLSLPAAGVAASAVAQMIGEEAIRYYSKPAIEFTPAQPA